MSEYSRSAKGHFVSTGNAQIVNLPFQPDRIELLNYTAASTPANHGIPFAKWDVSMGQGFGIAEIFNATPVSTSGVILSNGFSTFSGGLLLQYGPLQLLGTTSGDGIALTSSSVLTVTAQLTDTVQPGDWIVFQNLYETSTTGMQQISGIPFQVQSTNYAANGTTTVFQVAWNGTGTGLTAIDSAATGSVALALGFRKILYPTLYEPGIAYPYSISVSAGVGTVVFTAPHNFQIGQEIAFRLPSAYGAQELNSLPNVLRPGSPKYFYVATVANSTTITFNNAPSLSSAFNLNQTFQSFPGLTFAQVVAVGDINTGGTLYSGGALYPSPQIYTNLTQASTINGPAILGAYINNTSQGFIIGNGNVKVGAADADTSSHLVGANADVIYWVAYLDDLQVN